MEGARPKKKPRQGLRCIPRLPRRPAPARQATRESPLANPDPHRDVPKDEARHRGSYQQRPAPEDGEYFKATWLKPCDKLPAGEKTEDQPQRRLAMLESRECGARTRKGMLSIACDAVPDARRRIHRGIRTPGHGHYSEVAKAERSFVNAAPKECSGTLV